MSDFSLNTGGSPSTHLTLNINQLWSDRRVSTLTPYACVSLEWMKTGLNLQWSSVFHHNAPPLFPPGTDCWGLWNYEVVELFIVGQNESYLELEWGPYGHSLALRLKGIRQLQSRVQLPFVPQIIRHDSEWKGSYLIPFNELPLPQEGSFNTEFVYQVNAFAIWNDDTIRRYAVASPLQGETPDFHQIDQFPSFKFKI